MVEQMGGSLVVKDSSRSTGKLAGDIIPRLIDEIPVIALLATQAEGTLKMQLN
ncbi:3-phosphoshikimate 1-carboxyvinyltransferase [Listeria monocytogenes N53-1]|nr:3-phosphoshikimate 1-carboxyvinyltransferase [Listeria monocytogenes N53-1]